MMATLTTHNNLISNVASNAQNSASSQAGKSEEWSNRNHTGGAKDENTQKKGENVGKCVNK